MTKTQTDIRNSCYHCHADIEKNIDISVKDKRFCCQGCVSVYQILSQNDLCQYYDLNILAGLKVEEKVNSFDFIEEIKEEFIRFRDENSTHILLHIPQIHCSSCFWLLERLNKINPNILSSEVNFEKKEVYITFDESQLKTSEVFRLLDSLGYSPSLDSNHHKKDSLQHTKRNEILHLGVSGFCFANIMMLSFPEYLSSGMFAQSILHGFIPYIILALSLPVFFYSSSKFFIPAYNKLKNGALSIELPISAAIIVTFFRSVHDIILGYGSGYLDSMAGIVFFMLIGRWLQNRTHDFLQFDRNFKSYFPIYVDVIKDGFQKNTRIQEVEVNDLIRVYNNEIIPVDAILSKGSALVDYSFVNGESIPVKKNIGDKLYAGGKQLDGSIELLVSRKHSRSQLISLWNHYAFSEKKNEENTDTNTNNLSNYFTAYVVVLSIAASIYWYSIGEITTMWNVLTTVLIIACPCALLLSTNFTNGHMIQLLGREHFFVRDYSVLSNFSKIKHIIFDKTGTITFAKNQKTSYRGEELSDKMVEDIVSILSNTNHPLARGIVSYFDINFNKNCENFKETIGSGVEGWIDDAYYKIGSDKFCQISPNIPSTHVNICKDNKHVGSFIFTNKYRKGVFNMIHSLKDNFKISILSGDNDSEYHYLRKKLPEASNFVFSQSPLQKLEFVEKNEKDSTMMIGDGLNDAGAFQVSKIAMAVSEKNNYFVPAADIISDTENITRLDSIIRFVNASKSVINITFIYSLLYNVIGLYFALRGELSPIIAAIIMPVSSISIILIIKIMTEYNYFKYLKPTSIWKS